MRGKFIVLEGIDGSGTTTGTRLLAKELNRRGIPTVSTYEPTDGAVGEFIRRVLRHEIVPLPWETMALLFAADRMQHVKEIRSFLDAGRTVVSDRYVLSSLIYQSATASVSEDFAWLWIKALNERAIEPDLTIVLHVAATTAKTRREERKGRPELFEDEDLQLKLALRYAMRCPESQVLRHVSSDGTPDQTLKEILAHVLPLYGVTS